MTFVKPDGKVVVNAANVYNFDSARTDTELTGIKKIGDKKKMATIAITADSKSTSNYLETL